MTVEWDITFGLRLEAKHNRASGLDRAEIERRVAQVCSSLGLPRPAPPPAGAAVRRGAAARRAGQGHRAPEDQYRRTRDRLINNDAEMSHPDTAPGSCCCTGFLRSPGWVFVASSWSCHDRGLCCSSCCL